MDLPKKHEPVTVARLLKLARYYEKQDIVEAIEAGKVPDDVFASDGCSFWFDSWKGKSMYGACFWHDVRYWLGLVGDELARLFADLELVKDVAISTGEYGMARTMFSGVSVGGAEGSPLREVSWGYGWLS